MLQLLECLYVNVINRNYNRFFFMSKRTHSPPPYPELAKRYKHQSELESGPAGMAQPKPTFIRISDDEKCMLGLAKDELVSSLDESWLVSPTKQLSHRQPSEDPICASSLTIGVGQNTSFIQKKLKTALSENNPSFESLKNWVDTIVSESINTTTLVTPHFFQCQAKILTKLARCGSEIHNVTELRYILGDPIMEMLCTIFSLKVCLYILWNVECMITVLYVLSGKAGGISITTT